MGQGQSKDFNENVEEEEIITPPECFGPGLPFTQFLDFTIDEKVWQYFKKRYDKKVIAREDLETAKEIQVWEGQWDFLQEYEGTDPLVTSKDYWTRLPMFLELIGHHIETIIIRLHDCGIPEVMNGIRTSKLDFLMRLPVLAPRLTALQVTESSLMGVSEEDRKLYLAKARDLKIEGLKIMVVDESSGSGFLGSLMAALIVSGSKTIRHLDIPASLLSLLPEDATESVVFTGLTYLGLSDFGCWITEEDTFPALICRLFPNIRSLDIRENSYGPGPEFKTFVDAVVAGTPSFQSLIVQPLVSMRMDVTTSKIKRIPRLVVDVTREPVIVLAVLSHVAQVDVVAVKGQVMSGLSQERVKVEIGNHCMQVPRVEFID